LKAFRSNSRVISEAMPALPSWIAHRHAVDDGLLDTRRRGAVLGTSLVETFSPFQRKVSPMRSTK
jgi:hypothetical protein